MTWKQINYNLYTPKIQMGKAHIEAIAGAIRSRSPMCKLLIFGCGFDSPLWNSLNSDGFTVFLETSEVWRSKILESNPHLNILLYSLEGVTVQSSLTSDMAKDAPPPPSCIQNIQWDVILIDGPPGHEQHQPGRALPIIWVSKIRKKSTHVFLHDYERPLETLYGNLFLDVMAVIKDPDKHQQLAWSVGISV